MKKILLSTLLLFFLIVAFFWMHNTMPVLRNAHQNPAEEYLLSLQYPAFGEGINEYRRAVYQELKKFRKTRGAGTWQLEGPFNTGGRINCIAIHPTQANTYLVGCADGGIFKTTDDALTWQPIFDNAPSLSVSQIVYDNSNPQIIYAGTGDQVLGGYSHVGTGIYKSTDGGNTWNYSGLINVGAISKIVIDPSNSQTLYVGAMGNPFIADTNRGVYKSTNGGASWTKVLGLGLQAGIADLVINSINPGTLYATGRYRYRSDTQSLLNGIEARIYRTTDGGNTWDTLSNGLPMGPQCRIGLCISSNNPNILYANYVDTTLDFSGLYKTSNGGNSWSLVNNMSSVNGGGFAWYFGEIRMDPSNDNRLFVLGVGLYTSSNGGLTFTADNGFLHSDKHDLRFVNTNKLLVATDGGFYQSTNGGVSWVQKNNLPITQFYELAYNGFDTANYYGGAQDNGTNYGSLQGGINNWIRYYGGDGFRPQFNPLDPQVFYAEWQNGNVVATNDGGASFNPISSSINSIDRCSWNTPYMISRFNPDVLYFGSYQLYKNSNGPVDNWTSISPDLTDGTDNAFHVITTIDQSPFNAQYLYVGTSDARVWTSTNDGNTWTLVNSGLTPRNISCVMASPDSLGHVFVSQTGYRNNDSLPHIYNSATNGNSWTSIAGNLPNFSISDIWVQPGSKDSNILVANDGGVYATKDRGQNWVRVGNNMPIIPVFDLDYNPSTKRIMAGTFARSLMTMPIDSIFPTKTSGNVGISNVLSGVSCTLYPNPVADQFRLEIKNAQFQQAILYDMRGTMCKRYLKNDTQRYTTEGLADGYYVLHIITPQGAINQQLIIKH